MQKKDKVGEVEAVENGTEIPAGLADVGPYRPSPQDDQLVSVLFYVCSQKGDITQSKNKWEGGGGWGEKKRKEIYIIVSYTNLLTGL